MTPDEVRSIMTGESPGLDRTRKFFLRVPSEPRCKLCWAPFGGLGGRVFSRAGYGRSDGNSALCKKCEIVLGKRGLTGVEIPVTLLFSDIRGSTAMGENMRPAEFHTFLDHFYRLATDAIVTHKGLVDKVVGDEVIGLFFGGISGPNHGEAAVEAALDLAARVSRANVTSSGAIPVGTAVHTGEAFVGGTGPVGKINDFTALGDVVNTTARLASAAGAGEVIVSVAVADAAGTVTDGLERRTVAIRGRTHPIDVIVLRPADT